MFSEITEYQTSKNGCSLLKNFFEPEYRQKREYPHKIKAFQIHFKI